MSEFATTLLTSSVVSTGFAGLLLWLFKSWIGERLKSAIKSEYDQKLESHKDRLKSESNVAIERLKSQLSMIAYEHQVQIGKLQEKRAEIIAEVYAMIHELWKCVGAYTTMVILDDKNPEEKRKEVVKAHERLQKFYRPKQIFVPKSTAENINKIIDGLAGSANEFLYDVELASASHNRNARWRRISEEVGKVLWTPKMRQGVKVETSSVEVRDLK